MLYNLQMFHLVCCDLITFTEAKKNYIALKQSFQIGFVSGLPNKLESWKNLEFENLVLKHLEDLEF